MELLNLSNISKVFNIGEESAVTALKDINLTLNKSDFAVVTGVSGSGKSTLLNIIGTIDEPTSGEYFFNGIKVDFNSDKQLNEIRSSNLGFIYQHFNLLPVLTVVENVEIAVATILPRKQLREKSYDLLKKVGLQDKINKFPAQLSGGQKQRVAIARALISDPKLVLADEPTANLDDKNTLSLIDLMLEINKQSNTCFLFSTHDNRLLENVTRKIQLSDGRLYEVD